MYISKTVFSLANVHVDDHIGRGKARKYRVFGFIDVFYRPVHVNHRVNSYNNLNVSLPENYLTQNIIFHRRICIAKGTHCVTTYKTHTRTNICNAVTA